MKTKKQGKRNKRLSLGERIQIEIDYKQGMSMAEIAKHLGKGRNKSTVSREIGGRPRKGQGKYNCFKGKQT